MIKKGLLASITLIFCSSSLAKSVVFSVSAFPSSKLTCSIEKRLNGKVYLEIDQEKYIGCLPMSPKRVRVRGQVMDQMTDVMDSNLASLKGMTCDVGATYELDGSCEFNSLFGYKSTDVTASASCESTSAQSEQGFCESLNACRGVFVEFLSQDNFGTVRTNLSEYNQKPEVALYGFDQMARAQGCRM